MKSSVLKISLLIVVLAVLPLVQVVSAFTNSSTGLSEYLVNYGEESLALERALGYGCRVVRVFDIFGIALVECPRSAGGKLGNLAVPNLEVAKAGTELRVLGSLREFESQSGEYEYVTLWSWAVSRVGADITWRYLKTSGRGVVVAVLDTGIDPDHPLLFGKLITADPNDPRYPGGWIEFDRKGRPVCTNPRDTDGHGTWVSSIIAGGDTSAYIFGVVPEAMLMVASVLPGGYGTFAQVLAGLEWVLRPYDCYKRYLITPTPAVVSMSLGALGNYSNIFLPAVEKLIQAGIVVVAAVGNGGPHSSANPGNVWGVVGVGATDFDDRVAYFSSYEEVEWPSPPPRWPFKGHYPSRYSKPDIVAPGVRVVGAFPGGLLAIGSGTSASAPVVAGVAAMVSRELSRTGLSGARLVEAVYDVLTRTAAKLDQPGSGFGRIRSYLAVSTAMDTAVKSVYVSTVPAKTVPGGSVRITAGVQAGAPVEIYISGVRVYSGTYHPAGISLKVPYTHIGGNIVVVVSSDGRTYGEALVSVDPAITLDRNLTSGEMYDLVISGLGPGDTVVVYAINTLLIDGANLRGTLRTKIIAPYVTTPRTIQVVAEDYSMPGVYLTTSVLVSPPVTRVETVREPEPALRAGVEDYYVVGQVGTVRVLLPQEGYSVSLRQVYPEQVVLKVLNISLYRNLAVFTINITSYPPHGVVFVEVSACLRDRCVRGIEPLHIALVDPLKPLADSLKNVEKLIEDLRTSLASERERVGRVELEVSKLNAVVSTLVRNLSNIRLAILDMERSVAGLSGRVAFVERQIPRVEKLEATSAELRYRVEKFEESLTELEESSALALEDIRRLTTLTYVALLASLVAIAASLSLLVKLLKRS
ncbi:MAG: S8 family serine peptidase [Sulfolobales archaeon]|nr:S8 family serine peptidase [Sulfolobales archaeon]MCX8209051.1 S8 family serine peptidase [Sulfolobales archaeon]MDW8009973.1 S8 family serine peptidase [Sulfolobales archaeon]